MSAERTRAVLSAVGDRFTGAAAPRRQDNQYAKKHLNVVGLAREPA